MGMGIGRVRGPGALGGSRVRLSGRFRNDRQAGILPCVESPGNVGDIFETGALEHAAGDHAPIAAFTVHCHRRIRIEFGQLRAKIIQRMPGCFRQVACLPFPFATDI